MTKYNWTESGGTRPKYDYVDPPLQVVIAFSGLDTVQNELLSLFTELGSIHTSHCFRFELLQPTIMQIVHA